MNYPNYFIHSFIKKSVQLLVCHLKSQWKHRVVALVLVYEFLGFAGKTTNLHRAFFTFCSKVSRSGHRKNWEMSWEASLNGHRDGERVGSRGCACSMAPLRPWDAIKKLFERHSVTPLGADPSRQAENQDWKMIGYHFSAQKRLLFSHPHISQQNLKTISRWTERARGRERWSWQSRPGTDRDGDLVQIQRRAIDSNVTWERIKPV